MPSLKLLPLFVVLAAVAAGCSKKTEPNEPSGGGGATTDRDRLQGMWKIESLEDGRPDGKKRQEEIKNDRIKVEGNKFTILADGDEIKFTFAVDESKTPKVLTLTEVVEDGKPRRGGVTSRGTKRTEPEPPSEPQKWDWIYKFEGDKLTVAFTKDEKKAAPTEFKARDSKFEDGKYEAGVSVVTLVKTTEPPPPNEPRKPGVTMRAGTKK